jgi:PAS domain S-box-containing protein
MVIWDLDLKTYKTRTNLRHNQIYGYSEPLIEWGPDSVRQHVLPEDLATLEAAFAQAMELGESTMEVRVRRLDGQVCWISGQCRVYYDEAGTPIRMAGVTQDITERKLTEEALQKSEERHIFLLALSDALKEVGEARAIMAIAAEHLGRHLDADTVGYVEIDAMGKYFTIESIWATEKTPGPPERHKLEIFGPALVAEVRQGRTVAFTDAFTYPLTQGEAVAAAYVRTDTRAAIITPLIKDGRYVAAFYVKQRQPRHWTQEEKALTEEVANRIWAAAARARAEEELRVSEERFRRYFELGLIGMAISSPTQGIVEVNDELCRIFGYTRSELLQMTWAELTHPDDLSINVAQFKRVMASTAMCWTNGASARMARSLTQLFP